MGTTIIETKLIKGLYNPTRSLLRRREEEDEEEGKVRKKKKHLLE
jgi:hypothetical protein